MQILLFIHSNLWAFNPKQFSNLYKIVSANCYGDALGEVWCDLQFVNTKAGSIYKL